MLYEANNNTSGLWFGYYTRVDSTKVKRESVLRRDNETRGSIFVLSLAASMIVSVSSYDYFPSEYETHSIFAASHGGDNITDEICTRNLGSWDGEPDNEVVQKTNISLSQKNGLPQLAAAYQGLELHLNSSNNSIISNSAFWHTSYLSNPLVAGAALDARSRTPNYVG